MKEVLVSIVIPVYNRERYLRECLQSCMDQVYRPIEVVLVNDGSTDGSARIIENFISTHQYEPGVSFRYRMQQNMGSAIARNSGLEMASGEFIQFLDSDDLFTQQGISRKVEAIASHDVVFGDCFKIDADSRVLKKYAYLRYHDQHPVAYVAGMSIVTGCLLFRSRCFETLRFDPSVQVLQDRELCIRLLLQGFTFRYIDEVVYQHRLPGDDNISSPQWVTRNPYRYVHTHTIILGQLRTLEPNTAKLASHRIARDLWKRGRHLLLSRNREAADAYFHYAIKVNNGKIPKGIFFRLGSRILSHWRVERLYCFFKYRTPHKYQANNKQAEV